MSRRTFWDEPRAAVFRCAECGEKVPGHEDVAFDSRCARCASDLHSCRNCSFFDGAAENECRQGVAVRVAKKRVNNTCDQFQPVLAVDLRGASEGAGKEADARAALEALFK